MSEKIAFVCNANCQRRNNVSDSQIDLVKITLDEKGYDVRTRGCLQICVLSESLGVSPMNTDIVNVELHDGTGMKQAIAGMNGNSVGVRTILKR